jgi:hypothetical protein
MNLGHFYMVGTHYLATNVRFGEDLVEKKQEKDL